MPLIRKRPAPVHDHSDAEAASPAVSQPATARGARRRRSSPSASESEGAESDDDPAPNGSFALDDPNDPDGSLAIMVKKMVRLAMACEYSRQPIRRADIGVKVLGNHSRRFKEVFIAAQMELRQTFAMEMVELPMKEKVTISQRRAAQKSEKTASSTKSYILRSVLPEEYRTNETILRPAKVPSSQTEGAYIGLYTFIISVISLSGGTVGEAKLERYLKRTNAEQYTPIDKTEKLLQRMAKEGYLVKLRDTSGGEEVVEYMVGPRGKLEIGAEGVMGVARTVYAGEEDEMATLDARLRRTLGLKETKTKARAAVDNAEQGNGAPRRRTRGDARRSQAAEDAAEEEAEEDESEEDDE